MKVRKSYIAIFVALLMPIICIAAQNDYSCSRNYGKSIAVFGGSFSVIKESNVAKDFWVNNLNLKLTNYGINGAGFSNLTNGGTKCIQNQVDSACSVYVPIYDIYLLWASTNDFAIANGYVGEVTDYTEFDHFDKKKLKTQCGGMNYCIQKIYNKNPNAEILFFTSIGCFKYGAKGSDPNYQDKGGMNSFVEKQKEVCRKWGIEYFDQFNTYITVANYKYYLQEDKLHLSEAGYDYIKNAQLDFLADLYVINSIKNLKMNGKCIMYGINGELLDEKNKSRIYIKNGKKFLWSIK